MGEIGAALSSAAKAVQAARQAKQTLGGQADTSDPGVQATPVSLPQGGAPDMSQPMQQGGGAQPDPGITMSSLSAPSQAPEDNSTPTPDNPYTPDDNLSNAAASSGSQDDNPITVTGDGWTPPHKEGWLGKTLDVMMMLKGRGTPFKDRKDQENIEDAMRTYQSNPEQAIKRVSQVDVPTAAKLYTQLQQNRSEQALAAQREQARQDTGRDRLGNMLGAIQGNDQQKAATYSKLLPTFQKYATSYGLDPSELPETYDPDKISALRMQGVSSYDQGRLQQEGINSANTEAYRQTQISLDKLGKAISMGNLKETISHDQTTEARLDQGQVLQAKQQAEKAGVTLNSAFAPYMNMKPGQYVFSPDKTQVVMKRPDGYVYRFPVQKRKDGSTFIDTDNPTLRGTTVEGYLSK